MAKTTSSRIGWSKAWWVAEPSPLVKSTQPEMPRTPRGRRATTTGCEQRRERGRDPSGHRRVGDDPSQAQRQQRVGLPELGLGAVGCAEQAERAQLGLGEEADVVLRHLTAVGRADHRGDLGEAALAVDGLEDQVEQRGQLDRLPVRASDQGRRRAVAGPRPAHRAGRVRWRAQADSGSLRGRSRRQDAGAGASASGPGVLPGR